MSKLIIQILHPFKVIRIYKINFFLWLLFTIIFGQLGILINTIVRNKIIGASIIQSFTIDSMSGSFYTFSIALLGSVIGFIFINLVEEEKNKFKSIKIITIVISFIILIFTSVYYSLSIPTNKDILTKLNNISTDIPQLIFYILSIIIAVYAFALKQMDMQYENFQYLENTYAESDNKNVDEMLSRSKTINKDNKGNKL